MKNTRKVSLFALFLGLVAGPALPESVVLKNGRSIEAVSHQIRDAKVEIQLTSGGVMTIPVSELSAVSGTETTRSASVPIKTAGVNVRRSREHEAELAVRADAALLAGAPY